MQTTFYDFGGLSRRLPVRALLGFLVVIGLIAAPASRAQIGKDWRLRTPLPTAENLAAITWTGSQAVVVGGSGVILTSADNSTWTSQTVGTEPFQSVASSGTTIMVVPGGINGVWLSNDGVTWTRPVPSVPDQSSIDHVIWTGSQWVAVGNSSSGQLLLASTDGQQWTKLGTLPAISASATRSLNALVWTGSAYVVVGGIIDPDTGMDTPLVLTSADGSAWSTPALTVAPATYSNQLRDVNWTGTMAVSVGTNGMIYTSPDGLTWTQRTSVSATDDLNAVVWTGSQWVVLSDSLQTSPDGVTWTAQTAPTGPFFVNAAVWTGTQVIAVDASAGVFTSTDGTAFTQRLPASGSNAHMQAVAASPGGLLALNNSMQALTSATGDTWMPHSVGTMLASLNGVVWSGSQWVAVGGLLAGGGLVASSDDGVTWDTDTTTFDAGEQLDAIAFYSGHYAAVGADEFGSGLIATSTDGFNWAKATVPDGAELLRSVLHTGAQWIAVGEFGTIITSPNLTTWSLRTTTTLQTLTGIASSGPMIVAVGGGNTTLTSTNGVTWTARDTVSLDTPDWISVTWTGSDFIKTGTDGAVSTSTDGITWTRQHPGSSQDLRSIVWDSTRQQAVAVGTNGIVVSADAIPRVQFATASDVVFENDGTASVVVQLNFASANTVTVSLIKSGTAISGTDYAGIPAAVTFNPQEIAKVITVTLINNGTPQPERSLTLALGAPVNARLGAQTSHSITITDDDNPPPVTFVQSSAVANEGVGAVGVEVQLGWTPGADVTVPITLSGTADSSRYTVTPSSLTFSAGGGRSQMVSIAIHDDTIQQSDETVVLSLGTLANAVPGAVTSYTLTLQDNDPTSVLGGQWTLRNPLPSSEGINAIASLPGGKAVIVGNHGLVMISTDGGQHWTQSFTGSSANLQTVAWTGSLVIAAGNGGHVLTSPTGDVWSDHVIPGANTVTFNALARDDASRLYAAGTAHNSITGVDSPVVYHSTDALRWQLDSMPDTAHGTLQSIAYADTRFVAIGAVTSTAKSPLILTSSDGLTWSDHSGAVPGVLFTKVIAANDTFFAFSNGTKVYSSADGATWTAINAGSGAKGVLSAGVWTGTQFVAVGGDIATSPTGSVWTQRASGTTVLLKDVAWLGASNYLAIGGTSTVVASSDGLVWSPRSSGVDLLGGGTAEGFLGVTWSGTQFVAVGGVEPGSAAVATSPDGTTWTKRTVAAPMPLAAVAWSGTLFVAVGGQGAIRTSPDGITWTARASGTQLNLNSVTWANGLFVAVGGQSLDDSFTLGLPGSVVLTSTNGVAWTRRSIPTALPLNGVLYTGSLLVAAGDQGEMLTSTDGIAWTHRSTGVQYDLYHTAWSGSQFVTTGSNGILTSADANTWSQDGVPASYAAQKSPGGICWTGAQFVAVGDDGGLFTSADGATWTLRYTGTGNTLCDVTWSGSTLVAVGEGGAILSSGGGPVPAPVVQFATTETQVPESFGTVKLLVTVSPAAAAKVTVAFKIDYTTAAAADIVAPVSPLVFYPGETSKFISIPIKNDAVDENQEALTVTLTSASGGAATLGTNLVHTIRIDNDDTVPTIAPAPQHQLVQTGAPLTISSGATGSGTLTFQWYKNDVPIAGATHPVYYVPSATTALAGRYKMVVKNASGSATSSPVEVGVYDGSHKTYAVASGTTSFSFIQTAAGNGLSYSWVDDQGNPITFGPLVTLDTTGKVLTIHNVSASNAGKYRGQVRQAASNLLDNAALFELGVVTTPPAFTTTTLTLPAATVGENYSSGVGSYINASAAATFTVTGLPAGLVMDADGNITGRPTTAVTNKALSIVATNARGHVSLPASITVKILPVGFAGVWSGLVERQDAVNNGLGSRIDLTLNPAGSFTGKMVTGATTTSLTGGALIVDTAGTSATGTALVALAGGKTLHLTFAINTITTPATLTGTVATGLAGAPADGTASFNAWQALPPTDTQSYQGAYNFALSLPAGLVGDPTTPQGKGYGILTALANGTYSIVGKLGDGSAITSSSFVGSSRQFLIYSSLYAGKGSLHGTTSLVLGGTTPSWLDTQVTPATVTWSKLPDASAAGARTYPQGWTPIDLAIAGSKFTAPGTDQRLMNLPDNGLNPNASLHFTEGGIATTPPLPDVDLDILDSSQVLVTFFTNPRLTFLSLAPLSGAFGGSFKMLDTMPNGVVLTRTVGFQGLIVRTFTAGQPVYEGVGWFVLPQLPSANVSPMPLPTSTPILSGRVSLSP